MPFCLKCQVDYPDTHKICPQCASRKFSGNRYQDRSGGGGGFTNLILLAGSFAAALLTLATLIQILFAIPGIIKEPRSIVAFIDLPLRLIVFLALMIAFWKVASLTSKT